MPSAFICSSSRCNSGFVTAGPNHHHRIMIRQSSGGFKNDFSRSASFSSCCAALLGSCTKQASRTISITTLQWRLLGIRKPGLRSCPNYPFADSPSLHELQLFEIRQHFLTVALRTDLEVHLSDYAGGIDQESVARGKRHPVVFHDGAVL